MPQFFFHLRSPDGLQRDETGLEFDGLEVAFLEGYRAIITMASDLALANRSAAGHSMEISDEHGCVLIDIPFSEPFGFERQDLLISNRQLRGSVRHELRQARQFCADIRAERDGMAAAIAGLYALARAG